MFKSSIFVVVLVCWAIVSHAAPPEVHPNVLFEKPFAVQFDMVTRTYHSLDRIVETHEDGSLTITIPNVILNGKPATQEGYMDETLGLPYTESAFSRSIHYRTQKDYLLINSGSGGRKSRVAQGIWKGKVWQVSARYSNHTGTWKAEGTPKESRKIDSFVGWYPHQHQWLAKGHASSAPLETSGAGDIREWSPESGASSPRYKAIGDAMPAIVYWCHPDGKNLMELDVEDVQVFNGITVPLRIREFYNATLGQKPLMHTYTNIHFRPLTEEQYTMALKEMLGQFVDEAEVIKPPPLLAR